MLGKDVMGEALEEATPLPSSFCFTPHARVEWQGCCSAGAAEKECEKKLTLPSAYGIFLPQSYAFQGSLTFDGVLV